MEPQWKYVNNDRLVVRRVWSDGKQESCSILAAEIQEWLQAGNVILEPDLASE